MAPSFTSNDGPPSGRSSVAPSTKVARHPNWLRELRTRLPREVFEPVPIRLLWLPVHGLLIALELFLLTRSSAWPLRLALSLMLGVSFAGLAFVAHETLHGALCRQRTVRYLVGSLGFLPFCLSPQLWLAWHNRVHHQNTNVVGKDPDCLATLAEYESDSGVRLSTTLQTRTFGLFTLLIGFTIQSATVLIRSKRLGYLTPQGHRRALAETLLGALFWMAVMTWIGWGLVLFAYVIPLLIGNAIVMAHIVTNHGQMPLDEGKGPLATSLSVTVPRWFSLYTLDFGYHTEHHLLPTVSHRYGPRIREVLREVAPNEYHSMPLTDALRAYFRNLRVYADAHTLLDPQTGERAAALGTPSTPSPSGYPPPSAKSNERRSQRPKLSTRPSPAH
jgi:fatty acid desaturase